MVDSVWGNAGTGAARQSLQLASGRDPVDGKAGRVELPKAVETRSIDGKAAALVSEGRTAIRDMAAEPPVNSARVAELRAAIGNGTYRVEPERIADAMLHSEARSTRA
jgi:flagellar biosynthesis anti-sigma factor FlgM